MERYLAERGPTSDDFLFDAEGGLTLKQEILNALRTAGLLVKRIRTGDLRASFENAIVSSAPEDPRSYYLVGLQPPGGLPDLIDHPSLSDLERLLRKSGHLYQDVHELWNYKAA